MSAAMPLSTLLQDLPVVLPDPALVVRGLTLDSRQVRPGDAFIALPGARTHGLAHAATARAQGAAVVLFEPPLPEGSAPPQDAVAVPGLRAALGLVADRFHGHPSAALQLVGVTGTNGKTSTVQLLVQALDRRGHVAGSIGTLGAGLHGALEAGERTTPDVLAVHALLAGLRDAGATHVAMEVSSHALDQGRVDDVAFRVAVFTNLTRDHLDYHGSMEAYGAAKARLFAWPGLQAAVINLDDAFGRTLAQSLHGVPLIGVSAAGAPGAALRAEALVLDGEGIGFTLCAGEARVPVRSPLLGRFNVDNLLAVGGVLQALGWSLPEIGDALSALRPVPGRMNRLGGSTQPLVVIDYAHTPDALAQALHSLRAHTRGRLWCVFGCGGERDRGKRPQMAAIAEAGADAVVVTDDNPRGEPGDVIVAEILEGFAVPTQARVQRDRARAIAEAIAQAAPGDVVLVAGKGHEPYQEIDGVRLPFDDTDVARHALEARA